MEPMDGLVLLLGGVLLVLIGGWTVVHPDGGYRAAGGAGSGFEPGTRRVLGYGVGAIGVAILLSGLAALA
jgi:hypothetical protein